MAAGGLKILLADDHAVVRSGLREILAEGLLCSIFGEARNTHEALALLWKEKWDIVVLDITMPGRSGLEVLREIKKSYPKMPVLVLSMHLESQFAVRVLKKGASGYITKESAPSKKSWRAVFTLAGLWHKRWRPNSRPIRTSPCRTCFRTESTTCCA